MCTVLLCTGAGLAEADENCRKFLDKTIVDCFTKVYYLTHPHTLTHSPHSPPSQLLTHEAVFRWDTSIMEGILDMTQLFMELVAERLKHPPIPLTLLHLLATVRGGSPCN